ncbi:muts domain V-domain-containing protein [Tuber brumale]|nr:muts domain V-domain-containing protein [Tuber brumale]
MRTIMCRSSSEVSVKRTIWDDDGDDDLEFLPQDNLVKGSDEGSENAAIDSDDFIVSDTAPTKTPRKARDSKKRKKSNNDFHGTPSPTLKTPASASRFVFNPTSGRTLPVSSGSTPRPQPPAAPTGRKDRDEVRYYWLVDIKDADGNTPDHPDYDPRTLFVPPSAWLKFSPFEKQYWEIKSRLYDTVVFFKKGKFYELYEDDATIGHREFDLKLTDRVNMRMVGVPESSLDMWAAQFIAKGYKIARVDQKETALGKEMREKCGKAGKEEKIIRRELACVLTGGTLVDESMLQDEMATYCVAIKESFDEKEPSFGIAFVDTATGEFSLSEFEDDLELTKFETFLAQIRPRELIIEKGLLSSQSTRLLKNNTSLTTIWNKLKPGVEFWEGSTTVRELMKQDYFNVGSSEDRKGWPQALEEAKEKGLAMSALGALLCYLQTLKIDRELVSLGNFRIFANSSDGGPTGTLFSLLNRCITPFGKRMFKQWVCHPLADSAKINARLDAVEFLNSNNGFQEAFATHLNKVPDLERLISRIHAGSSRAADFLRVLEGFEQIRDAMDEITLYNEGGGLIGQLLASMPDLRRSLKQWESAFDRGKAKTQGLLVPERGVELDFDASQDVIEDIINVELESLLTEYRSSLKSRDIKYTDSGKEIYLIEVPVKFARNIPKSWTQMSGTQKVKRFYSPEIKKLVRSLQEAQETHSQIVKEVAGRFYERFDRDYQTWLGAVKIVANLDCLVSLARSSTSLGETTCRPTFVEGERSVLDFMGLRHPCMVSSVDDFIPNDIQLGGDSPKLGLLTGANAAGKSTVLRMTCVGVIMAQIGCFVPSKSARLTPVDRIMSRLGANDNIFAAQSTFFVELSETKKILAEATPHSLVILDELGRGTSSYDGVAVAQSVLHHVATHIGCLGFFATHYHSLAGEFIGHPEIQPKRMQIHVDEENRDITFLYKLEAGVAEGSFGMHCAAMCGINKRIIDRAEDAARSFEHTSRLKDSLEAARVGAYIPLGMQSDLAWILQGGCDISDNAFDTIVKCIKAL